MLYRVWVASDSTQGRYYEQESNSAMDAAMEFGRAESGEIVQVLGAVNCSDVIVTVYWASCYRKYRSANIANSY